MSLGLATPFACAAQQAPRIALVSPSAEETIHDNTGTVAVSATVENAGSTPNGLAIRVLLDGKAYGELQHAATFTLHEIDRGAHSLQLELLDSAGKTIAASAPVTFYLWQASVLFRGRK